MIHKTIIINRPTTFFFIENSMITVNLWLDCDIFCYCQELFANKLFVLLTLRKKTIILSYMTNKKQTALQLQNLHLCSINIRWTFKANKLNMPCVKKYRKYTNQSHKTFTQYTFKHKSVEKIKFEENIFELLFFTIFVYDLSKQRAKKFWFESGSI